MKLIFSSQPGRVHREKYTKIMACISNKWPLPLSPQIKTLFTNSRLICDRVWALLDAFRRHRSHFIALHPQVGNSPPGRENGVWWHTQPPTPHDSGDVRCIRSYAAGMQCVNGVGLRYVGHQQRMRGPMATLTRHRRSDFGASMAKLRYRPPPGAT